MRFTYSVVRFVPSPARGEFINVGAVAGSEDAFDWEVRQIENPARARRLDEDGVLDAVWRFIDQLGSQIDEYEAALDTLLDSTTELTEAWLWDLHHRHRNIVQLSPPAPLVAESAAEALDLVFDSHILDPAKRSFPFKKKNTVLAALRRAYRSANLELGSGVKHGVTLATTHHHERMDFAVVNGSALQLTQAWSFQLPDQETLAESVKAWAWTVRDARETGAHIRTSDGQEYDVANDIDVRAVYVPPTGTMPTDAMAEALHAFAELEVEAHPVDDVDLVATRAAELLGT